MYDAASCQHVCLNKNAVWRSARWLYRLVTAAQSHSEAVYIRVHGYEQSDVCTQFFFFFYMFCRGLVLEIHSFLGVLGCTFRTSLKRYRQRFWTKISDSWLFHSSLIYIHMQVFIWILAKTMCTEEEVLARISVICTSAGYTGALNHWLLSREAGSLINSSELTKGHINTALVLGFSATTDQQFQGKLAVRPAERYSGCILAWCTEIECILFVGIYLKCMDGDSGER